MVVNCISQLPEGRLLSQFVIDLAAPLLRLRASSNSTNGHPKGLVVLILAAVSIKSVTIRLPARPNSCAFILRAARYLSKPSIQVSPKEFSKEHYGSKVKTYHDGFHGKNGVPDDRWEEFVEVCEGPSEDMGEDSTLEADLSILDHNRPFIFDFCSPAKSRT